jgi:hypothetical protein
MNSYEARKVRASLLLEMKRSVSHTARFDESAGIVKSTGAIRRYAKFILAAGLKEGECRSAAFFMPIDPPRCPPP